jgi:hypothetical protein
MAKSLAEVSLMLESDRNFQTIEQAWFAFRRNCMSDLTPTKIAKGFEGSFYAGAQSMFIILTEALNIDPQNCPENFGKLFAEMQAWFAVAQADAKSKMEEKANASKKRTR